MPRPTKLTPELRTRLVDLLRAGCFLNTAAEYVAVDPRTVRRWLERGRRERSGRYAEFTNEVQRASADAEIRSLLMIQQAASKQWQAAAWFLERRNPTRWGRRSALRVEVQRAVQRMLEAIEPEMSAASYRELIIALAKVHGIDTSGVEEEDDEAG